MSEIIIGLITSNYVELAFPHRVLVEEPSVKQRPSSLGRACSSQTSPVILLSAFYLVSDPEGPLNKTMKQHLLISSSITSSKAMASMGPVHGTSCCANASPTTISPKYRNHSNSPRPETQDRKGDFLMNEVRALREELYLLHRETVSGTDDSTLLVLNSQEVTRSPRAGSCCPVSCLRQTGALETPTPLGFL